MSALIGEKARTVRRPSRVPRGSLSPGWLASAAVACALILLACPVPGQRTTPQPPATGQQQQPSQGAQVRIGTSSGLVADSRLQSLPPQPAYVAETIPRTVGNTTVNAHYVQVLTQPLGNAALDDVYGVLGVDVLDQMKTYTFDYRTMRFGIGPE